MNQVAQAVLFGGECVVSVNVTESVERLLGSGKPTGAPAATLRVDTFCPDGVASATAALGASDYDFTSESAVVDAAAGAWHVTMTWQASAEPQTFVVRDGTTRTHLQNAPVVVDGTVSDGDATLGPDAVVMADLARVRTTAKS